MKMKAIVYEKYGPPEVHQLKEVYMHAWLFVVFPFEFAYFADVLPDFLRFLVQWISNDIARGVIALWIIVNLVAAVYYGTLRVFVRKELSKRKE